MAAFNAYVLWFSEEQWPLINELQMAAGGLGALVATTPVEAALQVTDWRGIFTFLRIFTLLGAVLIFLVAFAGQWAIGAIIKLWPINPDGNYALKGYQAGFAVMLCAQILCLVWFFIASIRKRG